MDANSIVMIEVFVVLFGGLVGLFVVSSVLAVRKNNAQPVQTVLVQVVSLYKGLLTAPRPMAVGHTVKFRTDDGKILKVAVTDDAVFYQMTEGTYGILTLRGWTYISFVPSHPPVTSPLLPPD